MTSTRRCVYLAPGDYFVGPAPCEVRTVLGSCVSITLWEPRRRVGAMSHFLLGQRSAAAQGARDTLDARYGPEALALMFEGLSRLGIGGTECEAKLFGGGSMFPEQDVDGALSIGRNNGAVALALLRAYGIPVVSYSLFGVGHRRIVFDVSTGDVWAQREEHVSGLAPPDLMERPPHPAPLRARP